ncbi:MAG TPA: sulfatase [Thermoanaerobaculia bacterium]|nr:sulfatase [Thermoanaerobaculia bacterium]
MPEIRHFAGIALLTLSLSALSCHREPPRPRNVILILVDTLRADRLSAWGYARPTSPNLDAFARESVQFKNARSQSACTFPSANSLLTSRWPAAFLGQPDQALGIPANIPSLAGILQSRGFHTVAVSASAVVRKSPSRFNPKGGFDRGFDVFQEDCVWQHADCVNREASAHLRRGEKPLFLYLHYIDPHGPYRPPDSWRHRFATGAPEKEWVRKGDPNPIGDWLYKGKPSPGLTPGDLQYLKALYDEEIAYFDSQFAELLRSIRAAGLLDDSLVVLTADHGEEFLEHGDVKHCRNLFDTSAHVPLLVRIPGVGSKTVSRPVQNLDLVPTILDYLGAGAKGDRFDGRSLRGKIEGKETPDELQYGLMGELRSVSDGRFKLIENLAGAAPPALFDLAADPGETKNVLPAERRAYARLRDALTAWLARNEGKGAVDEAREAQKKLKSLGYIE